MDQISYHIYSMTLYVNVKEVRLHIRRNKPIVVMQMEDFRLVMLSISNNWLVAAKRS